MRDLLKFVCKSMTRSVLGYLFLCIAAVAIGVIFDKSHRGSYLYIMLGILTLTFFIVIFMILRLYNDEREKEYLKGCEKESQNKDKES